MLNNGEKLACSEAYCVYNMLTEEERARVNPDFLKYLEENKSDTIEVKLSPSYPLYIQTISEDRLEND